MLLLHRRAVLVLCLLRVSTPSRSVLRIPLAQLARDHLKQHPVASEFLKVVKLESPVAITAFDNSVRNETDFFYFKANVNASLPITITLLKHSEILVWTPEPFPGPFAYWLTLPGPGSREPPVLIVS